MKTLYGLYAIFSTGFNLVWKILPAFLAAFLGAFDISLIFTAFFASRVLIIPIGMTSDKIGPVKSIGLSFSLMVLMILSFLFFFGVKSLAGWIVFALVAGVIVNLIEIAAAAIASREKKKTKALFGLESMYQVGVVLGPILGGLLAASFGMEAALLTWAVLNILGIFTTSKLSVETEKKERLSGGLLLAIKEKKFLFLMVLLVGSFLTGFLQSMQELVLPLFAKQIGFDIAQIGLMIGLGSVITIFGLLFIGKKVDSLHRFRMLFVFFLLMLSFPLIISVFNDFLTLTIMGGIFLIGRASNLNISRGFFSEFSDKYKATAIGIGETVYYFSRSVGSVSTGLLIKDFGYIGTLVSMVGVTVLGLAGVLILIVYSKRRKSPD